MTRNSIPTLDTERLRLRALEMRDASTITALLQERDIALTAANIPYPFEEIDARAWVRGASETLFMGHSYTFAITRREDSAFMGAIGLEVTISHRRGEIGYWMGKPYWGAGYMTEAARRLVRFGFEELNLNRIDGNCYVDNIGSARVLEKCGMTYEGTLREYLFNRVTQVYEDVRYYSILRSEYYARS
jgi:[ribosomal protein S5]-alanine N-acetyltransferase